MDGEAVTLFGPAPAPSDGQMANDAGPPADREASTPEKHPAHIQQAKENEERALAPPARPTTCDGQLPGSAVLSGPVPENPMPKTGQLALAAVPPGPLPAAPTALAVPVHPPKMMASLQ